MITEHKAGLDDLVTNFLACWPKLNSFEQQLSLELYRLLAKGQPVPPALLAERVGTTVHNVDRVLEQWPGVFFDAQHHVVGYWGLSLLSAYDGPHKLIIGGRTLSAWCAWDTLFLPELLGETAEVESTSPNSGATVRLTVSPKKVHHLSAPEIYLSFLQPSPGALQKVILSAFCCFVHFFPSREAGESWVAHHDGTFLLSVEEGFSLAHRKNLAQYGQILP